MVDLVLDGTLDFGDQGYVVLRQRINNLLRFTHKISLERVSLISYFCRGPAFDEMLEVDNREWDDALAALSSDEAREHVRRIYGLALTEVIKQTVFGRFWWICMEALASTWRRSGRLGWSWNRSRKTSFTRSRLSKRTTHSMREIGGQCLLG